MAKRNSSGSSSGRRGASRTNSGGGFSGRKKSSDKPYKKSDSKTTGRSSAFDKGVRGSFGKKDNTSEGRAGQSRPYKKSDKPYGKREDGSSSESRGKSYGDRKSGFSSGPRRSSGDSFKKSDKPFKSRSENSSESGGRSYDNNRGTFSKDRGDSRGSGRTSDKPYSRRKDDSSGSSSSPSRPYKKSNKPYGKRDDGSSESRGKSYGERKSGFSSGLRRSSDSFKKSDKPFRRKSDDSSESGGKSLGNRRSSFSKDKGEGSNFKKTDKPFDTKKEGSSESKGAGRREDKFKKGPSFGLPYKRTYEKKGDLPPDIEKKSPDSISEEGNGEKPKRERRETSDNEPKRFLKKAKGRYSEKSPGRKSESDSSAPAQTDKIRLNRYIANSGVCSRREADELIAMGLVSVNGKTVTEMGYKVNPGDEVRYENKMLTAEKPVYILLNKPKGYLTTTADPQERNTVMHIIGSAVKARIYPVGRLDRNTTGLLLLTNDGELAEKLMHPSYNVKKIYKVELDKPLTKADFQSIREGVKLEEGRAAVDDLAIISDDGKSIGVELHIGWNRVIRRIFEHFGYQVIRLDRSVYAGLDKKNLGRGEWRYLTKEEVVRIKHYN